MFPSACARAKPCLCSRSEINEPAAHSRNASAQVPDLGQAQHICQAIIDLLQDKGINAGIGILSRCSLPTQAAPKTNAPPAVTQEMRNISQSKAQAAGYGSIEGEVLVWSLALCGLCSAASAFFYSQVGLHMLMQLTCIVAEWRLVDTSMMMLGVWCHCWQLWRLGQPCRLA